MRTSDPEYIKFVFVMAKNDAEPKVQSAKGCLDTDFTI